MGLNCSFGATELHPYVNALNPQVDGMVCVYPNAGLPNELGAYDEPPEMTAKLVKGWAENGWLNVVGGCCGTTPAHIKAIAEAVKGVQAAAVACPAAGAAALGHGSGEFLLMSVQENDEPKDAPRATFINIGERTNVTGSARFKKLILEGDYTAAIEVARQQVESGAQIIDVNMDEGLLDSELAMDTFLKLIAVGARHRPRADHDRQLQVERDRGRPEMRRRQADRELDLHEGGHRALHRARPQGAPLRRRGRGHGVRREGPGRHQGAQGRDLRPRLRHPGEPGGLPGRGHHLRPQHLRGRHRHRGAQQLRRRFHRGDARDQAALPGREDLGRRVEPVLRLPRQRAGAQGHALGVPLPCHPGRHGHGHRQCGPARGLRPDPAGAARRLRGRDPQSQPGGDRAAARARAQVQGHRRGRRDAGRRMAQLAGREAAGACAGQGHGPVRRRRHRGGAPADRPADRGHRGPADGRHERGRRPVRLGQDVPAAGGEERPRHEEGGRPPAALHRGGEDLDVAAQGQDRHGDGQGRRPRHRQEHRGRGPAVQQFRGHRSWRHGAVPGHPEVGQRQQGRHDRALAA